MKRGDEYTKTSFWFANANIYSLLRFLLIVEKRETEYELSRPLYLEKRKIKRREGDADIDLDINFLVLCCTSFTCLFSESVLIASRLGSSCLYIVAVS